MIKFSGKIFKKLRKAKFDTVRDFVKALNEAGAKLSWTAVANWEKKSVTPRADYYITACEVLKIEIHECFINKQKQGKRNEQASKNRKSVTSQSYVF